MDVGAGEPQPGDGRGSWWLRALAILVAGLPWRALRLPGALLGWLAGSVLRIRRGHVELDWYRTTSVLEDKNFLKMDLLVDLFLRL